MDIYEYKNRAESFLYKRDKEYYLHFSGLKNTLDVIEIYDEFSDLFTGEIIDYFKNIMDNSSGEEKKKARFLLKFCTEGYIEMIARDLIEKVAEDEAAAKITVDDKEIPFRYSEILLANEPDKNKRDSIDDKRNKVVAENLNNNLYNYWAAVHGEAARLGFSGYRELFSYLKNEDFSKLQAEMTGLLKETQDLYEKHFGDLLKEKLGITFNDSRRSDFAFLKRAKKYDRFFKKDSLIPVFRDTLLEIGIDIENCSNIHLDVGERENKSPRAFCSTPGIPQEIYLVMMPAGGQDDFEAVLHEGGHALHFGNTDSKLDFEYRCLGDNALTEGYAFCMEELMQNKRWLTDFFKMNRQQADEFVYFSNLIKLWFCRRYAGKLKYEMILHDGTPLSGRDSVYKEILSDVNLMDYPGGNYLKDVDNGFYCTNYIRAWIFQSQVKDYLYRKFGHNWYKKKKAGFFFKELWSYGQKYSVDEILSWLGFEGMDLSCLIDSLIIEIKDYKRKFL